jgi:hypothetical protein
MRGSAGVVAGSRLGMMSSLGTRVVTDSHYKRAVSMGKVPTSKQEEEDWDFEG